MKIIWEGRNLWHEATTHGLYRGSGCIAWQIKTSKNADCSKEEAQSECRLWSFIPETLVQYHIMDIAVLFYAMSRYNFAYFWKKARSSRGLLIKRTLCCSLALPWLLWPTGHLCPFPPETLTRAGQMPDPRYLPTKKAVCPFTGFVIFEHCNVPVFRVVLLKWLINCRKKDWEINCDA